MYNCLKAQYRNWGTLFKKAILKTDEKKWYHKTLEQQWMGQSEKVNSNEHLQNHLILVLYRSQKSSSN